MRRMTALGSIFVLVITVFTAMMMNVSSYGSTLGMVSYWKFTEGSGTIAYDSVGDNDGTLLGGAGYASDGVCGYAVELDGIDDYIEVPDDDSLDFTDEITIEAWIKPSVTSQRYAVHKGWHQGQTGCGGPYSLDIYPGRVRAIVIEHDGTFHGATGTTNIVADTWQHIALTWDGTTVKAFYNGNKEGSTSFTGIMAISEGEVLIGRYGGLFFDGLIDEVAIYNKALTEDEIKARYEQGLTCLEVATIDIDPDTLNQKGNGEWVTCYIELLEGYNVADIVINSILLNEVIPAEEWPWEVGDYDGDNIPDLMVKFDRAEVMNLFGESIDYEEGIKFYEVTLTVTGELTDGTMFEGEDTVKVISK